VPRFKRRQSPQAYSDYSNYKPYLRLDFRWRCCYCGVRERKWGGQSHFAVEHFQPKKLFPLLETTYSNLYYACDKCNGCKWRWWPNPADIAAGRRFFDPCSDLSKKHFRLDLTGMLQNLSDCGWYTIKTVRLNRKVLVDMRREHLQLIREYRKALRAVRDLSNKYLNCANLDEQQLLIRAILAIESNLVRAKLEFAFAPHG